MKSELGRMLTIFVIQIIGAIVALGSVFKLGNCTNISPKLSKIMKGFVIGIFVVTLLSFIFHKDILRLILTEITGTEITGEEKSYLTFLTCDVALSLFALLDLLGLGLLIWATGGSARSIYIPYLLIIVPLAAMLEAPITIIVICFFLTVIVFWKGYFGVKNVAFEVNEQKIYERHFAVITSVCVIFPTGIQVAVSYFA